MSSPAFRTTERKFVQRDEECHDFYNKKGFFYSYHWIVHYCAVMKPFIDRDRYHFCFPYCRHLNSKSLVQIHAEAYSPTDRHTPDVEAHIDGYNHDSWIEFIADISETNRTKPTRTKNMFYNKIDGVGLKAFSSGFLLNISTLSLVTSYQTVDELLWFEIKNPRVALSFLVTVESFSPVFSPRTHIVPKCRNKVFTITDKCWDRTAFYLHSTAWIGAMTLSPQAGIKCFYIPGVPVNATLTTTYKGAPFTFCG